MTQSTESYGKVTSIDYIQYYLGFYLEYLFKFLIIGSASTGKTCILRQFLENECKLFIDYLIVYKYD